MQSVRNYEPSHLRVAIVTGLSDPNSCDLHEHQFDFLSSVIHRCKEIANIDIELDRLVVRKNFPFIESAFENDSTSQSRPPNLVVASFANTLQFLKCRTTKYRALSNPHWKQLFESTSHLIIITGSCGLQLLDDAISRLASQRKVDILALGPVVYRPLVVGPSMSPGITIEAVQGTRDWISRLSYRGNSTLVRGLGHLGYWMNHETREIACQWLSSKISR